MTSTLPPAVYYYFRHGKNEDFETLNQSRARNSHADRAISGTTAAIAGLTDDKTTEKRKSRLWRR